MLTQANAVQVPRRPILRYHGGKWRLAPWIISYFPEHRIYVEPFGGAASVLMQKQRSYSEVYNDMDGEIVSLFRVLRNPLEATRLIDMLRLTPFAKDEFLESYMPSKDPIEQARRTIFRSFAGFSSGAACGHQTGFRANSNRLGTTPAHDWRNFPDCLADIIGRLQGVVIENKNATDIIKQHDTPNTLFYLDPPYPLSTRMPRAHYSGVYRYEMTEDEHRELAETIKTICGMAVISGYPCDLYDKELYPHWKRIERDAKADCALPRVEVLWLSEKTVNELKRPSQRMLPLQREML